MEYRLIRDKKGGLLLGKVKKVIVVNVTYGNKNLLDCMKNVIREKGNR